MLRDNPVNGWCSIAVALLICGRGIEKSRGKIQGSKRRLGTFNPIGEARRDGPEVNVTSNLLVQTKIPQSSLGNQDLHIQLVSFQRK